MNKRIIMGLTGILLLTSLTGCGESGGKEDSFPVEKEGYELVWQDEFDGDSLDLTKWSYQLGDGGEYGNVGWGNNESQWYTNSSENVFVEDGHLTIKAIKDTNAEHTFTSGRIRTITDDNEVLFATTYGRVEARIMMEGGSGIWPAFWMLPVDPSIYGTWAASGEIDIMEAKGRLPEQVAGTAHFGKQWPDNVYKSMEYFFKDEENIRGYHTYAVEWTPSEMKWFVDDHCYFSIKDWYSRNNQNAANYTKPAPFDVPFYILLNVAVGGNFDPDAVLNDNSFPAAMNVDYVRVYHREGGYAEEEAECNASSMVKDSEEKEPLRSGQMLYNRGFDQGIDHMGYWHKENMDASVTNEDGVRKLHVSNIKAGAKLYQNGIALEEGKEYGLRLDCDAEKVTNIEITITNESKEVVEQTVLEVNPGETHPVWLFTATQTGEKLTVSFGFEEKSELYLDNILMLKRTKE